MQHIANLGPIKDLLEKAAGQPTALAPSNLLRLPSTAELVANLEREPTDWNQKMVRWGQLRDNLQADRPDGCWCLGIGGREARTMLNGIRVYYETCPCPEGRDEYEHWHQQVDLEWDRLISQRVEGLWANAGIPERFWEMRLETSPVSKKILNRMADPREYGLEEDSPEFEAMVQRRDDWRNSSWFFYGGYGTGKTCLAIGLAYERIQGPDGAASLKFVSMPRMLSELRSTYNKTEGPTELEIIDRYAEADLLILDDMGAEHVRDTGWLEDRLYQIIGERHNSLRSTLFTSNLSIERLAGRIGERVTWRIVEMVGKDRIVHVDGPNLRSLQS